MMMMVMVIMNTHGDGDGVGDDDDADDVQWSVLVARRQPSSAQGFTQAAIHGLIKQNQFIMMMNMMMIMMVLMIGKVRS